MKNLYIDIETYSNADLKKCGVYKYAEDPSFEILLFAYSVDGDEVKVVDLALGEQIPSDVVKALTDESVIKWAHNASFERVCLSRYFGNGDYLNPKSWRCSMVWCASLGLPLSLEGVGLILGLEQQKLKEGKDLIKYFCTACKPTKTNGMRSRNYYFHDLEKWKLFKSYNKRDVEVELSIIKRLSKHPLPESVWDEYEIDQKINDRGVLVDKQLVLKAIEVNNVSSEKLTNRLKEITQVENPNSVKQLKEWLATHDVDVESLGKKQVKTLLESAPESIREMLELRLKLSKSSIKKYQAIVNTMCSDNRVRGMFQFFGASRTGRWAGRYVQLHNLVRNEIANIKLAREDVKNLRYEELETKYEDIPDLLSQLIRTAFIAKEDCKFIVSDYSAIEARVLSWFANEKWRMDVFKDNGDIYCATASRMFGVPVVKHGENGHLRQKGKQAELACIAEGQFVLTDRGVVPIEEVAIYDKVFDGSEYVSHEGVICKGEKEVIEYEGLCATPNHMVYVVGLSQPVALIRAKNARLPLETVYHEIPQFSPKVARVYDIVNAGTKHCFTVQGKLVHNCGYGGSVGALKAMGAIEMGLKEEELNPLVKSWREANPKIVQFWWDVDKAAKTAIRDRIVTETHHLKFSYESGILFIELPSKRRLSYVKPKLAIGKFGSEVITYEGTGQTKKWERIETYGPKLVENIVQATSRDILAETMKRVDGIVMHIHDELVVESAKDIKVDEISKAMGVVPDWAEGLVLNAEGYETGFYLKD